MQDVCHTAIYVTKNLFNASARYVLFSMQYHCPGATGTKTNKESVCLHM